MKQEEKDLLLKDLSSRLMNNVIIEGLEKPEPLTIKSLAINMVMDDNLYLPYLRPMSSMTEKEKEEWYSQSHVDYDPEYKPDPTLSLDDCHLSIDWLNAHHFDYRGLIERGLALEAPDGMYNLEEK